MTHLDERAIISLSVYIIIWLDARSTYILYGCARPCRQRRLIAERRNEAKKPVIAIAFTPFLHLYFTFCNIKQPCYSSVRYCSLIALLLSILRFFHASFQFCSPSSFPYQSFSISFPVNFHSTLLLRVASTPCLFSTSLAAFICHFLPFPIFLLARHVLNKVGLQHSFNSLFKILHCIKSNSLTRLLVQTLKSLLPQSMLHEHQPSYERSSQRIDCRPTYCTVAQSPAF